MASQSYTFSIPTCFLSYESKEPLLFRVLYLKNHKSHMVDTSVSLAQQSSPCIFVTPSQHNCRNDAVQLMSADVNYPLTELKSAKGPTLYSCCTQTVSSCSPRPPEVVAKAQQPAQHNIQACYPVVHATARAYMFTRFIHLIVVDWS
jgi:hypothetical protein